MSEIKRVLWVENDPGNRASKLFLPDETKIVKTMDEAIIEFSGETLYQYDTIVLDIDFKEAIKNSHEVINRLQQKIFLSKDQSKKSFVEDNGGYLLFLYLLEQGYPSDQVAFLTGNGPMIEQLKRFSQQNEEKSTDEIADDIIDAWKDAKNECGDDCLSIFAQKFDSMPIGMKYKSDKFYEKCVGLLIDSNFDDIKALVSNVEPVSSTDPIENTGDKIIFRFHEANLEAPCYFSKNENDIEEHNQADAQKWLNNQRTNEHLCRWLVLDAGKYIKNCFESDRETMNRQIQDIFSSIPENGDASIYSAYSQMFYVFDSLRSPQHYGAYYQAILAMLIPFEASQYPSAKNVDEVRSDKKELQIRKMCSYCLKQARNYCAHNYMGTTLSIESTLFLLMISMTAILNNDQRSDKIDWYKRSSNIINDGFTLEFAENVENSQNKILNLTNDLLSRNKIDTYEAEKKRTELEYQVTNTTSPHDILIVLGCNIEIDKTNQASKVKRESYYLFVLASYILGWFNYEPVDKVENMYDQSVACLYKSAQNIVNAYEYPITL